MLATLKTKQPITAQVPVCYFCSGRVTRKEPAWLLLAAEHVTPSIESRTKSGALMVRGQWSYPGCWESDRDFVPVAVFSHAACITEAIDLRSYGIEISRAHELDWSEHLKRKTWWWDEIDQALEIARSVR